MAAAPAADRASRVTQDGVGIGVLWDHRERRHLDVSRIPTHVLTVAVQHLDLVGHRVGVTDDVARIGVHARRGAASCVPRRRQ